MGNRSTGRKAIDSYIKHEDIVDNAVKLGKKNNLDVSPTDGNDPRGDIRVASKDMKKFIEILGSTIDQQQRNK